MNCRCVDRKFATTNNEKIAADFAFVFDLNYTISLEVAKERLKVLYERVEYKDTFKNIYEHAIKYLNERIEKQC